MVRCFSLKCMNSGTIHVPKLMVAPMAGYTDAPFRIICKKLGAEWVFTEMVSSDGIVAIFPLLEKWIKREKLQLLDADSTDKEVTKKYPISLYDIGKELGRKDVPRHLGLFSVAKIEEMERPISIQLFGNQPDVIAKATRIVLSLFHPDGIDINMGCPAKDVFRSGSGCALIGEPKKAINIVRKTREVVDEFSEEQRKRVLLSVKTRLGIKKDNELENIIEGLFGAGCDFVTVHARIYKDFFSGPVRFEALSRVVEKAHRVNGLVIGNGGIVDVESSQKMVRECNVDGVAVGRGAIGNPWIFQSLRKCRDIKPSIKERIKVVKQHAKLVWEIEGSQGIVEMRKHLGAYFKGFPFIKKFRLKLVTVETLSDVEDVLNAIEGEYLLK